MEKSEAEIDDWVQKALLDDRLVAEVLMVFSLPTRDLTLDVTCHPLQWGRRLPRSRQIDLAGIRKAKEGVEEETNDDDPSQARGSPLSPLSWSGGSGGGGGSDDPKRPSTIRPNGPRSSDKRKSEETNASEPKQRKTTSTGGRANKKKKIAELKEEENKLLLENAELHKRVEELNTTYGGLIKTHLILEDKIKVYMESVPRVATFCPLLTLVPWSSSANADAASAARVMVGAPNTGTSPQTSSERTMLEMSPSSSGEPSSFRIPDLNAEPQPEQ